MKKLISLLFAIALLGAVAPVASIVAADEILRDDQKGETLSKDAYVPCGTKDETKRVKQADGSFTTETATQTITLPAGTTKTISGDGIVDNPCKFTHIIELAKRLIMGGIIAGVIIATMGFAYAGLLYITAMGAQEKISHAHSIFIKTFWGFVFMLSAWLIAYTMESIFLSDKTRCNSFLTTPEDRVKLGCPTTP